MINTDLSENEIRNTDNKLFDMMKNIEEVLNESRQMIVKVFKMPSSKSKDMIYKLCSDGIFRKYLDVIKYPNRNPKYIRSIGKLFYSRYNFADREAEDIIKCICEHDDFGMYLFMKNNDNSILDSYLRKFSSEYGEYYEDDWSYYDDEIHYYINIIVSIVKYSSNNFLEKYKIEEPIHEKGVGILQIYFYISLIEFKNYSLKETINIKNISDNKYRPIHYSIDETTVLFVEDVLTELLIRNISKYLFKKTLSKILDEYSEIFRKFICRESNDNINIGLYYLLCNCNILNSNNLDSRRNYFLMIIQHVNMKKINIEISKTIKYYNRINHLEPYYGKKELIYFLIENKAQQLFTIKNIKKYESKYNNYINKILKIYQNKSYFPKEICIMTLKYTTFYDIIK